MGLFRTLIIFILVYFGFKFLFRYVIPILLGTYVQKKVNEMGYQQQQRSRQANPRHEGDVTIDYRNSSTAKKNYPKDSGDYVDYEEVKD